MKTKKKKPLKDLVPELKKWDDTFYVKAYDLAKSGMANMPIAKALGVSWTTFKSWMDVKPALVDALIRARATDDPKEKGLESIQEYIYKRLSPDAKVLWDKILGDPNDPDVLEEVDRILESRGKLARQQLFIHACIEHNFNLSEAGRLTGVPKALYDNWFRHDKGFQKLLMELKWHRKNFLDSAFWKGVAAGETALILHGQKTLNADRGFASKKQVNVNVSGSVAHRHKHTIGQVLKRLPIEERKKMLTAYQEAEREADDDVLDAEIIPNDDGD